MCRILPFSVLMVMGIAASALKLLNGASRITQASWISYLKQVETKQSPVSFACSFGAEDMVLLDYCKPCPEN